MIDKFDYLEPACPTCGGKEFYAFDPKAQQGAIPTPHIIEKLDSYLDREDYGAARRLLEYWLAEARMLKDIRGELSVLDEIIGLSRRIDDKKWGFDAIERSFALLDRGAIEDGVPKGTIYLNGATTLKAFGEPQRALPYYEKAKALFDAHLDADAALYGGLLNNMALCLVDLGRYDEAESFFRRAIEIMSDRKKPNGMLDVAVTHANLADLYAVRDEDSQAETDACMEACYAALHDPSVVQNGYYAFVCRKCAPVFGHYGYFAIEHELNAEADRIYGRD